jgi:hypothetical protein
MFHNQGEDAVTESIFMEKRSERSPLELALGPFNFKCKSVPVKCRY